MSLQAKFRNLFGKTQEETSGKTKYAHVDLMSIERRLYSVQGRHPVRLRDSSLEAESDDKVLIVKRRGGAYMIRMAAQ